MTRTSNRMTVNQREGLSAKSTITGNQEYLTSTSGILNATISGTALPIAAATTAIVTAIVDGSGNQITSFGAGTQYTDGGVPPAHPTGNTIEWSDGANWQTVSTAKPLPVTASVTPATGIVDANNSTTSTLLANATFTGTFTSVLGYSVVEVIVYSDQNSSAGGLLIEFSSDHVNWDDSSPWTFSSGSAGPNQGQTFIAGVRGQYVRVVYTNGGTNQTTFRLQTVLKPTTVNGDIVSINQGLNANNHAIVTNSQIFGLTTGGGGGYVPVKVNPSGTLTVASSTFDGAGTAITSNSTATAATTGLDINIRSILNTAPTTAGFLDIKGADGNVFVRQTTATNLKAQVVSGDATGAAVPANAYYMAGINGGGNLTGAHVGFGDANPTGNLLDIAAQVYNGASNDLMRSATAAAGTTGTGLLGAGIMVFDGTNYQRVTTNSTTFTSKNAADANLLGTLGTAFTTAGKVDIKGADGDVFVRQATAANLNATVVGTGTFAVQNTPVASAGIFNGKTTVTTAGTRVTLAASQAVQSVTIKALITNTGTIYVGNSSVASTNGFQLSAGETVSMDVANLNTVNLDSSVNGEGVTYIGIG